MLTRLLCTVKTSQPVFKQRSNQLIQKRFSSGEYWGYREWPYDPMGKAAHHMSEITMGVTYWWIMWNFYTDWRHITGEFIWPDTRKWTDEHLGIPPDDED